MQCSLKFSYYVITEEPFHDWVQCSRLNNSWVIFGFGGAVLRLCLAKCSMRQTFHRLRQRIQADLVGLQLGGFHLCAMDMFDADRDVVDSWIGLGRRDRKATGSRKQGSIVS